MKQFTVDLYKNIQLDTEKYIENRGLRGSEEKYLNVLKKAPHVPPRPDDVMKTKPHME